MSRQGFEDDVINGKNLKNLQKVIGEIIGVDIIFVLNKIDQIPEAQREKKLAQIEKQIQTKIIPNFAFKSTQIVTASAINGDLDQVLRRGFCIIIAYKLKES